MTTTKTQSWLWPDRRIYKRESRVLREEHNALVNLNADLLVALEGVMEIAELADLNTESGKRWVDKRMDAARAAIAKAKGGESQ